MSDLSIGDNLTEEADIVVGSDNKFRTQFSNGVGVKLQYIDLWMEESYQLRIGGGINDGSSGNQCQKVITSYEVGTAYTRKKTVQDTNSVEWNIVIPAIIVIPRGKDATTGYDSTTPYHRTLHSD